MCMAQVVCDNNDNKREPMYNAQTTATIHILLNIYLLSPIILIRPSSSFRLFARM